MKKFLFYLIIACLIAVMPKTVNAAETYAALSNDNTTLTFYYDNHTDYTYAHIDGGPSNPGYLTYTEEDETSIAEIKHDSTHLKTEYYNLTGNKLSGDPKKGIYIKNGKKYLK